MVSTFQSSNYLIWNKSKMDVVKSLQQNPIHGDTDPTSRINFSSLPPLKTTPTPLLKTNLCSLTRKSCGIQAIMKNTTMDSFNHQVSVKYLYKKNLTEQNDATKRIPTYNFLMSATSTSTKVRMTTDSSMRTDTGLTNPAEPGDRILNPLPPGTPSSHPSSVPLSSRALPLPKKQLSPPTSWSTSSSIPWTASITSQTLVFRSRILGFHQSARKVSWQPGAQLGGGARGQGRP